MHTVSAVEIAAFSRSGELRITLSFKWESLDDINISSIVLIRRRGVALLPPASFPL